MKRDLAIKALDSAASDQIGLLFRILVSNLEEKDANARGRFAAGIGFTAKACAEAMSVIEALPE